MKSSSSTTTFFNGRMTANSLSKVSSDWKHILIGEESISRTMAMIILVISCLQLLSLNFETATLNLDSRYREAGNAFSSALRMILTRREFNKMELTSTDMLVVIVGVSYMMLFLALNSIITFYPALKKKNNLSTLPIRWKGWSYIHLFVMSLPFHNLATDFVRATFNQSDPSARYVIGSFSAILLGIINIALCIIQLNLSSVIKTKDFFSRTNNLYLLSILIPKEIQSTLNCLALRSQDQQALRIVATIFGFVFSILNQAILASSWPFYKGTINQIFAYGGTANIVASMIALILVIIGKTLAASFNIFILWSVFLMFVTLGGKLNQSFFNHKLIRLNGTRHTSKLTSRHFGGSRASDLLRVYFQRHWFLIPQKRSSTWLGCSKVA